MSELAVQTTELAPTNTLFGTDNPAEVVERAAVVAKTLADLVRRQNLIVQIGQGEHVRVEGWTLLGSMLGVFPVVTWTQKVWSVQAPDSPAQHLGWEARVEARTRSGEIVGAAEAECLRSENTWKSRDDYALRSMAQTRAVSKALRLPLGFVMQLAGFEPTPAEEMPVIDAAAGTPFGDPDAVLPAPTSISETQPATEAQRKKLDVLVKNTVKPNLRRVYATVAQMRIVVTDTLIADLGGFGEDNELHWSPLRDSLTKAEAHELIDRLEKLEPEAA